MQAYTDIHPAAGLLPVGPFVYRAVDILRSAGWQMRIMPTRSGEHAIELAQQAAGKVEVVFAIGGTAHRAGSHRVGRFAHGVGHPACRDSQRAGHRTRPASVWVEPLVALDENLRQMVNAPVYKVDVGLCNGKPFFAVGRAGAGRDDHPAIGAAPAI